VIPESQDAREWSHVGGQVGFLVQNHVPQGSAFHGDDLLSLGTLAREPVTGTMRKERISSPPSVLSTAGGTRKDWVHAGQALQRVLLAATLRGIAAAPLTQPLETADAWLVRDPRADIEQPQMILRLGYGLPVPASPRRPVSDVLDEPE
jgi:nitroreductase